MKLQDFLTMFLASEVVVLSASALDANGFGLSPLVFDKEGTKMVAVFSSLDRAKAATAEARYALKVRARWVLEQLSGRFGLVLNPGFAEGFDITPEGIVNILRDFP